MADQAQLSKPQAAVPVVVKKYANRRLYNTETSSYITQDNLADMVKAGRDFVVYDARSGEDITRSVLTQIIVEAESKGTSMLPTPFLRHLIGFYGDSLQSVVPRYLEQAMASFAHQQQQMRQAYQQAITPFMPFGMEELSRSNLAMIERAMSLFSSFYKPADGKGGEPGKGAEPGKSGEPFDIELARLKDEVDRLKRELEGAKTSLKPAETEPQATE